MRPQPAHNPLQDALALHQAGRLDEAERAYRQLRASQPRLAQVWFLSGVLALQRNQAGEGAGHLQRALQLDPRNAAAQLNLGIAFTALGRRPEAQRALQTCLAVEPRNADGWYRLGVVHQAEGRLTEAVEAYRKAFEFNPKHGEAVDALGAVVAGSQGLEASLPWFEKATELNPKNAFAWCNRGIALSHMRRYAEALDSLDKAIALNAALAKAVTAKGLVMQQLYRLDEAAALFGRGAELDPGDGEAWSGRLLTLHYLDKTTPAALAEEHRRYGAAMRRSVGPAGARPLLWDGRRRLRVGFLSPDFRRHAVASFALPLLKHLDRSKFEVVAYHDHARVDEVSHEIQSFVDAWRHLAALPDSVVETRIQADSPDILFDLAGHTGINRLKIFARRVAPIQISYLGYPDTTGLDTMDFRFTDAFCDPEGATDAWHTEKLVRFAPVAWAFQPERDAPPPERADGGAPVFACFNNYAKVSDATVNLWSRVLAAVPDARLQLKGHDLDEAGFRGRLLARLGAAGIDPTRLDFLGRTPDTAGHLRAYQHVDIALDPFPYHGTTTTCESLWMGVPVVTLLGDAHVSRVSGSLLSAVGRGAWIAADADRYVTIASELARDVARVRAERQALRRAVAASALLDHAAQAQRFGEAILACAESRLAR